MKKRFLIVGTVVLFAVSFTKADSKAKTEPDSPNPAINITPVQMTGGELLIAKADCIGCHHKTNKLIGPSYTDVAKKYANNEKNISYLADKIIKGGSGVWGKIPMTPHAKITNADAKLMAKYILSLKK
ncbi:c-type cytochrome [Pedobacter montanisoli]|uniref:C-type cytochrome n=1 Tax=Pedobacter montanisoli TaxID=2923277 RepID=A0ABS9ZRM4_9SPHI|nr:c-type cytochrome [Pedobacter montanisoli]MCJ0741168.1 c-type cytochrome [Pedobacter montanisoli]